MSVRPSTPESKPVVTSKTTAASLPALLLQLDDDHEGESTGVKNARDQLLKMMGRTKGGAIKKGPTNVEERMQAGREKMAKEEASARAKQEKEKARLKAAQDERQKARDALQAEEAASGRAREVMAIVSALVQDAQYPPEDDRYGKGEQARDFLKVVNASEMYEKLNLTKEEERQTMIVILEKEFGGGVVEGSRENTLVNRVIEKYAIRPSDWKLKFLKPRQPRQPGPSGSSGPSGPSGPSTAPVPTPTPTPTLPTLTPEQESRRAAARKEREREAKSLPLTPWMDDAELKKLMEWMSG